MRTYAQHKSMHRSQPTQVGAHTGHTRNTVHTTHISQREHTIHTTPRTQRTAHAILSHVRQEVQAHEGDGDHSTYQPVRETVLGLLIDELVVLACVSYRAIEDGGEMERTCDYQPTYYMCVYTDVR